MTLRVGAASDVGLKRSQNEDRLAVWNPKGPESQTRGALLLVADGMGGAMAGEVASQLAAECVLQTYREGQEGILEDLLLALVSANQVIWEHSREHPELRGMGTTCTAVVVRNREIFYGHVGDSRAYLVRNGEIRQLTQDHSLVAQLVEQRHITPEQAKVDPRRNVVTRSVGVGEEVDVDTRLVDEQLVPGDTLVVCTDGLHSMVDDHDIARIASGPDPQRACQELITLANDHGGSDNITVVIGRVAG